MSVVTPVAATPEDVPHVLALLRECGLPEHGVSDGISEFAIARANGEVIACCGLEIYGAHGLLRSVAVSPRHRNQKIAASLVRDALARASRERLSSVFLLTTGAEGYFSRFGFQVFPRDRAPEGIRGSWEFRSGCPETAVFMRKRLTAQ